MRKILIAAAVLVLFAVLANGSGMNMGGGATGGSGTWGSVTGTLSDQTDLQNALNGKAPATGGTGIITLGVVSTGEWNATPIAVDYGGTGAQTAAAARANLGLGPTDNVTVNQLTATNGIIVPGSASTAGQVQLSELTGNGTDNIILRAPNSITTPYTIIFPAAPCANGAWLVSGGDNTYSCVTALPNGTTATTQSALDNSTKPATTAYVDQRAEYHRIIIDGPSTADNIVFFGPSDRGQFLDNAVMTLTDNTGVLSTSTDNVTVNIYICAAANTAMASCTKMYTNDRVVYQTVDTAALNNAVVAQGSYLRVGISAVAGATIGNRKLYIRLKYRSSVAS